ncbi:MAG: hypothetical protein ABI668_07220 [Sphingorhabdus sp.]
MRTSLPYLIIAATLVATPALGDKKDKLAEVRPPVFEALVNCRSVNDSTERLACYDTRVAAIDEAEKKDELVLADKQSMREAQRGLFGFALPKLRFFGNEDGKAEDFELVTKIGSAYQVGVGKWTIVLADGARWVQIDTQVLGKDPTSGMEIRLREAAMGSYFANIAGQRAIRMKRVN